MSLKSPQGQQWPTAVFGSPGLVARPAAGAHTWMGDDLHVGRMVDGLDGGDLAREILV